MINVKRPQKGQRTLQSIFDSVNSIIDYLPTLTVRGDNYSTYVEHSTAGTIIHAKQNVSPDQAGGKTYYAGSGLTLSGNLFSNDVTSGRFIQVTTGYAINCILSGGKDIQITPQGVINYTGEGGGGGSSYVYLGDGDVGSGHIFVDYTPQDNPIICSNLVYINDLLNYPISGNAIGSEPHFVQIKDIKDGAGTSIDYHWNSIGNHDYDTGELIKWIDGVCVNLNVSGGQYITTHFYNGTGAAGDNTSASIDCNLSGTYNWYPHTSGFIAIVPQTDANQNITGGIISTNLHAGSGIAIDPQTGEITCTIEGGGGTTIIASGLQYPNYSALYNDNNGSVSGIGISFILPVSAGQEYKYYTDARDEDEEQQGTYIEHAFATYAPAEGETGDSRRAIANGVEFVPSANGYIRISVFDDGKHQGKCLRFYKGGDTSYEYATPLYRFHGFTNYEAGAGIAIESGIISCMLQTDTNVLSGITSAALTTGNQYNPTITGIAIGLSTEWAQDLAKINQHTLVANKNKVLSSNNYGALVWADNVQIPPPVGADFKVPDFAKLQVTNDAGEGALGLGNTYLVPVSGGSTVRYSADGGTIIARWAPVKGSSKTAFEVTTTNKTTTDDGYVRISVIDPGTLSAGCLRLYVDNKDIPLHKFAQFNYSSGAIYEAGRYMQIQTTSTRVNPQTEQEEPYTLENPIIHNMLTGGRFITIQEEENNVELEYPRINCDLTGGDGIQITSAGVINLTGSANLSTVYNLLSEGPNIKLTKLSDGRTQISGTPEGSGGGGGGGNGPGWPDYNKLAGNGNDYCFTRKWYTTSTGGWLRIACKASDGQIYDCCSIYIDPQVPAAGANGVNHIGMYPGGAGNCWIIPVPPGSSFFVEFPQSKTVVLFDSTCSPAKHSAQDRNYGINLVPWYDDTEDYRDRTYSNMNSAESYKDECLGYSDYYDANEYAEYAESEADSAEYNAGQTSSYATDVAAAYDAMIAQGFTYETNYKTEAAAMAQDAAQYAQTARGYATAARTYTNGLPH